MQKIKKTLGSIKNNRYICGEISKVWFKTVLFCRYWHDTWQVVKLQGRGEKTD